MLFLFLIYLQFAGPKSVMYSQLYLLEELNYLQVTVRYASIYRICSNVIRTFPSDFEVLETECVLESRYGFAGVLWMIFRGSGLENRGAY